MKKCKNVFGTIFGFTIGTVIASITATYAATTLSSKNVYYDNSKSGGTSTNVSGAIDELYATADDQDILMAKIIDKIYPVGSIYLSTTESKVEDVVARFGGEWEVYSTGKTLIGAGTGTDSNNVSKTFTVSQTVTKTGAYESKLTLANLPSHNHTINHTHTTAPATISSSGAHKHDVISMWQGYSGWPSTSVAGYMISNSVLSGSSGTVTVNFAQITNSPVYMNNGGAHTHPIQSLSTNSQSTTTSGNAGYASNNITAVNVQDPYTVVYMYKRIN